MENKSKTIETVDSVVVSSTVLASLFGLTTRRIRMLENEGVIEKEGRGRYKLQENIKKYIVYLKANQDLKAEGKDDNDMDIELENGLLSRRKREKLELEIASMKGTMHKSEDVERVMNDMLANFRIKLLALPTKAAPRLIAREDMGEIQDILQEIVYEALNELSNYDPSSFYDDKYVVVDDEDLEEEINIEKEEDTEKDIKSI